MPGGFLFWQNVKFGGFPQKQISYAKEPALLTNLVDGS